MCTEPAFMKRILIALFSFLFLSLGARSQGLLDRTITIDVQKQRLDQVLEIISNKGNFYFSYNSSIIRKDSLVSLSARSQPVRRLLDLLFPDHYEFRESGNYIIIRRAPIRVTVTTNKAVAEDRFYTISGYVLDEETGAWIRNASIYEKTQLAATLTNMEGYFRLKMKQRKGKAVLTVSKTDYQDTSFQVDPGFNQQVTVTLLPVSYGSVTVIGPDDYFAPEQLKLRVQGDSSLTEYTYVKLDTGKVEKTRMGSFLLSSDQKAQALNLRKWFTSRPFQVSFTPGLGTHGQLSGQVSNLFSLNVLGGYNGGVKGAEIGGLFNIDKRSVEYVQVGGLFNIVGGRMRGFQAAGIHNTVLDHTSGMQVAGVNNFVKGKFAGFQVSGVYNHVTDSVKGVQVAGVGNYARRRVRGSQIAGVFNFANHTITGVQVAGVINYARRVKGTQIGLVNISDTADGPGIGLINIVFHGYHKLAFYTDEVVPVNAAFKTGSRQLYNILQAGFNPSDSEQIFTFGYGLGTELRLGRHFTINPELSAQQLYLGTWDEANILSKFRLQLNIELGKYISIFGGPVVNAYYSRQTARFTGYKTALPPASYKTWGLGSNVKGWLGWSAGLSFF